MCKHMDVDVEGKEQNCLSCELCKQIDLRIKAEGELKAIRDRVKAVTEEDMGNTDLDVFIKYIIGGEK